MTLLQRIKDKSHDDGGCWIWDGAMGSGGKTPVMSVDNKVQSVRRALAESIGMRVAGRFASNTCDERKCVCPDHIKMLTRSSIQLRSAAVLLGSVSETLRGKRIADAKRVNAKLTPDAVLAIRGSTDKQRDVAKQHGVSQQVVWSIKNHITWKDYTNPYAQLMGLAA